MATTSPSASGASAECDSRPTNGLEARAGELRETPSSGRVDFQFDDPAFQADPYPTYALLREREPICFRKTDDFEVCWLTRYRDVLELLRHPGFSAVRTPSDMMGPSVPEKFRRLGHLLTQMMLMKDAPDHTRLRGLVKKAFTPRVVSGLRPRVESIVAELLAAVRARGDGRMDVLQDLATPLPVIVIAELLGVPTEDRWRFKKWSDEIAVVLDGSVRTAGLPQAAESAAELAAYLRDVVAKRRTSPQPDLISGLAAARDESGALTDEELIANCVLILLAGHETTTNLIGNGVLALLHHPEQMQRLRADPGLAASAVEETLRYDSPVQGTSRIPLEAIDLLGVHFAAGIEINTSLGSANRDPEQFSDPDHFDIGRGDKSHLAFGFGAHFCLGASLARLEGEIALRQLVSELPPLQLVTDDPPRRPGLLLRGLAALPVTL